MGSSDGVPYVDEAGAGVARWVSLLRAWATSRRSFGLLALAFLLGFGTPAYADPDIAPPTGTLETLEAGSLVIPMDNNNQAVVAPFNLHAYGLVNVLLQNRIPVKWAILIGKAKDATDFTATAERVLPGALVPAVSKSFAGGPFIVPKKFAAKALAYASAYGENVAVYRTTADAVNVPIRYTLMFRPFIAISNVNTAIHATVMANAGIPGANACTGSSATCNWGQVNPVALTTTLGQCATVHLEPHRDNGDATNPANRAAVSSFLTSGGNFLAQCQAVSAFEQLNPAAGTFLSTQGVVIDNINQTLNFLKPDLAYSQIVGALAPQPGGSEQDFTLGAGIFKNNGYVAAQDTTSTNHFAAAAGKVKALDTLGGNVFYLGGHNYSTAGSTIEYVNGQRMVLNSIFVPVSRPDVCTVTFAAITGFVFYDNNKNGVYDAGDTPAANVTVTVTPSVGAPITLTTDASGNYASGISAGTANVVVTPPANGSPPPALYSVTTANATQNGIAVPAGVITSAANVGLAIPAAPAISKAFSPSPILLGATSELTFTITNSTATIPLTGVGFTDFLPAGLEVAAVPNVSYSGCGAGAFSPAAAPGAAALTFSGATVTNPTACVVKVTVKGTSTGVKSNVSGNVTSTNGGTGNTAAASLTVLAAPSLAKSFNPTAIAPGGTSTMTVTIGNTNAGAITLSGLFTDTYPAGLTNTNPAVTTGTTCSGVTAGNGAGSFSIASGTSIPAGGCTVVLAVTSSTSGAAVNTTGALSTSAGTAPAATATLTVLTVPTLAKSFSPSTIAPGGTSTLTVTISNANASAISLTGLFTDTYPAGMTNVSPADTTGTTCSGVTATAADNKFTIASGTVFGAGSCVVKVKVTSSTSGSAVNTTGSLSTSAGVGAPATSTLIVTNLPTLAKSFNPTTIAQGATSTMTVTIGNSNAFAITLSGVFTDTYPAGLANTNPADTTGTTCTGITAGNGAGSFTIASGTSIPAGGCVVSVKVTSSTAGAALNTTGALSTSAGVAPAASATLTVLALPTLAKSFAPTTIIPGGTSTMTVTIGNANAGAITLSALFTDTYPAGLTNTNPAVTTGTTCPGVTAGNGAGSFTIASGTSIPVGGCTVVLAVTSSTSGAAVNTTGALSTSAGTAPAATATLTVTALPVLAKTFDPVNIIAGGTSTLTVTINNANAGAITLSALFTDPYPAGLTNVSPADTTGTTCAGVTATAGDNKFTIASGTSIASGSCVVKVKVTSSTAGPAVNTTGSLSTSAGVGAPASATLTVSAIPTLAKSFTPATIVQGGTSTLTVTIGNSNAFAITLSGVFTDSYPAGLANVSPIDTTGTTCTGLTASPGAGNFTIASGTSIPVGGCVVSIQVTSSTPGPALNITGALSTSAGVAPAASAMLTVLDLPTLAKSFSPTTIIPGGTSTMTVTIGNANRVAVTLSALFTDTYPAGLTNTNPAVTTGTTCLGVTAGNGAGSFTIASGTSIPSGGCVVVLAVTSSTSGPAVNTTGALSTSAGTAPAATATLLVTTLPTLAKAFDPATIIAGATSTLTVTIDNANASAITLTALFTDTYPAGLTNVSPADTTGTTCPGVTATAGDNKFTIANSTSIPQGSCVVKVKVTSSTTGPAVNTTGSLTTSAGVGAPATSTLTVAAPPTLAKSFLPTTIAKGGTSTLTVTIFNPNAFAITVSGEFNDAYPSGMANTSPVVSTGTTCAGVTAEPGGGHFSIADGSVIPASSSCVVKMTVVGSTAGALVNDTGTIATSAGIGAKATATLTVLAPPVIAKAFSPTTIALNGTGTLVSTLTFTITNPNTSDALTGVGFTDSFPAGVVVAATPNVQVAGCGAGAFAPVVVAGAGSVTFAGATVANQTPCVVSVDVRGTSSGTKDNTSGAVTSTNGGTGNTAQATLTVLTVPTVDKIFDPTTIVHGGIATLTVIVHNLNGIPITLTSPFTDTFPAGMTIAAPGGSSGDCLGVTANAGAGSFTVASGTSIPVPGCTVVVRVTTHAVGAQVNQTDDIYTSAGVGTKGTSTLTVLNPPTVAKSFDPQIIVIGEQSKLTVTIGNANPGAYTLTGDFTDNLPFGMTVAGPLDTSGTTCAGVIAVAGAASFTIASGTTIAAGGCVVRVNVTSSTPGESVNTIAVDALQTTIGSNEFPAEATLTVIVAAAPIPTLGEFALLAMMLMLAGVAGACARRVRR